jgi:hemerythrin-like domain-containing protein
VVVGAGPGGLVTALESALLGARVTVIEKRTYLSRNNILHLWPITMRYLNALGAKIFYPKFGVGGMDHIGTKQIQRLLLKINLLLGVKFYFGHSFQELYKKTEESSEILTRCTPEISDLPCTLLIGADGVASTIAKRYQFNRTKFSGSLCIGMTFNFKNTHTPEEIRLREFALASLYHPAYFKEIQEKYHVALENLVYYQGETHYFVMTIKKNSLIERGVFKEIRNEISELVDYRNVIEEQLVALARDIATFCGVPETNGIVSNHLNKPDVQLFDFSERTQSDEASKLVEIECKCKTPESETEVVEKTEVSVQTKSNVIVTLVGDALIEPFWPLGTGCNRAVISGLDAAWIVHEMATKKPTPEIIKTRQGCYLKMKSALAETFVEPYKICLNPYTRYTTRRL